MNPTPRKIKVVVFLGAATLIAASLASATGVSRKRGVEQQMQEKQPITNTLPKIIHKVKDLKIVRSTIKGQATSNAVAVFKIENDSDKAVTAFNLTFGSASYGQDGGMDGDEPVVIIEPHETITVEIPLSNFIKGETIILAAVIYEDGSEDGQEAVLEWRHSQRARAKAEREAKMKGEPHQ